MFQSARIRLSLWYLLIIMMISIFFSIVIYVGATREFNRGLRLQRFRIEHPESSYRQDTDSFPSRILPVPNASLPTLDKNLIEELRFRIVLSLLAVNAAILLISGFAGYFLAGRTLAPIKEMMDEQNRFVADASHELRTPITVLRSEIEVSLRDKRLTLEKARELLKSNLEEVEILQLLSDNLLKLAQYQFTDQKKLLASYNIQNILQEAISKIMPLAQKKHISIKQDTQQKTILANKDALKEAFVILLDNAIKYSPDKSTITLTTKKSGQTLAVQIQDEGIGIEEKDIHAIFDRFYRADTSRSKIYVPGYGLGLSIAKQIVTLHKGTLTVASTPGKGSIFTVTLPLL